MPRLWPDRRLKPPFGAVEIDWAHPLSRGLLYLWIFNEGGGPPLELVRGSLLGASLSSGTTWTSGIKGLGLTFAAVGDAVSLNPLTTGNGDVTVIGRGLLLDTSPHAFIRITGGLAGGVDVYRFRHQNASNWAWELFNVTTLFSGFGGTASHYYSAACAYTRATSARFHIMDLTTGTLNTATASDASAPFSGAAGTGWTLGEEGTSLRSWQNYLESIVVYNRALPDAEMAMYHANPYAFLRPKVRPRRYFVTAVVNNTGAAEYHRRRQMVMA